MVNTLRPDEYLDKAGRVRRHIGKVPTCECCETNEAKVLLEIGRYRGDWMIQQCDVCLSWVCDKCCDVSDAGDVTCVDCLKNQAIRRSCDDARD